MGEDSPDATGLLSTAVTDQPGDIADFESCVATIDSIWVKPTSEDDAEDDDPTETDNQVQAQDEGDVDEGEGREYYGFDEPQDADLVDLQGVERQTVDVRRGERP